MSKKLFAIASILIFTMITAGCDSNQKAPKEKSQAPATQTQAAPAQGNMVLKKFGPTEIHAGMVFNKQPNGESAIWSETENATPATIFVLDGAELKSAVTGGKSVTAVVPQNLYATTGEYSLYLLDKKTNKKSNELKFVVKP